MNTVRQAIVSLLSEGQFTARAVSGVLGVSEKEVYEHLAHVSRSVRYMKKKLSVIPARCLECGYVFEDRNRFTPPARCPRCRGEHIHDPEYRIV